MNANDKNLRPLRIRIDEVQVNGEGETGGHGIYEVAAKSDECARFSKVSDIRTDTVGAAPADPPTA